MRIRAENIEFKGFLGWHCSILMVVLAFATTVLLLHTNLMGVDVDFSFHTTFQLQKEWVWVLSPSTCFGVKMVMNLDFKFSWICFSRTKRRFGSFLLSLVKIPLALAAALLMFEF